MIDVSNLYGPMAKLGGFEGSDTIAVENPPLVNIIITGIKNVTDNNPQINAFPILRPSAKSRCKRITFFESVEGVLEILCFMQFFLQESRKGRVLHCYISKSRHFFNWYMPRCLPDKNTLALLAFPCDYTFKVY
jgi:hypothetical protein